MAHVDNKLQGKQCCVSKGASGIFIDRPGTMGDSKKKKRRCIFQHQSRTNNVHICESLCQTCIYNPNWLSRGVKNDVKRFPLGFLMTFTCL